VLMHERQGYGKQFFTLDIVFGDRH
jgi:hypothetical protein